MGTGEGAAKRRANASPPDRWLEIEDKTIMGIREAAEEWHCTVPEARE